MSPSDPPPPLHPHFAASCFVSAGDVNIGVPGLLGGAMGLVVATAYVTTKHYIANNLLGIAFCMQVRAGAVG
jgi:hypothetical protein